MSSYEEQVAKTFDFCALPSHQLKAFRERVVKHFRDASTEQFTNYKYFVWRAMTQDEREVVASLILNGKTSQEIADALEFYWFGDEEKQGFQGDNEIPF